MYSVADVHAVHDWYDQSDNFGVESKAELAHWYNGDRYIWQRQACMVDLGMTHLGQGPMHLCGPLVAPPLTQEQSLQTTDSCE